MTIKKIQKVEKVEKTIWKPEDTRFVGFIDILGFKDSVLRETHSTIYDKLLELSDFMENFESHLVKQHDETFSNAEIKTFNFSDSIIVFSKSNTEGDFFLFIHSIMSLFSKAINTKIPLKGGVAYGKMTINQEKKIYFGQPLIDAYLLEEDLKYFGITTHHTFNKFIREELEEPKFTLDNLIFETLTPFKHGKTIHSNINWFEQLFFENGMIDDENPKKLEKAVNVVEEFRFSTSGSPRLYIDNTLNIINELYK